MDATQMISDSILESEDEESEEENENKRGQPLAKLCILKNKHISETELPLFLGDNVLGRDPNSCNLLLQASSVSKQHATICISAYRRKGCDRGVDIEALVWDQGSMNGTCKGRLKLTPNVRYALSEKDSLVVADIPCQFVSCAVDEISSRGDAKTPLSKNNGVTADMPAVSGEMEIDENRSSKSFANGGPTSRLSLPEDKRTIPVRHSCLTFEQTPTQPQASLVPQSDSDSDGEKGEGGERRRKALASNTDSYKSSPTCSTFLSPTNKVVPESEDESPITPSSSSQNRRASFSKEEAYVVVGRQQQKEKESLGVVDDREEDGGEEERAALAGEKSEESRQHVKQDGDVSLTRQDVLPVSSTTALTDDIPVFNMDSDTDVEGGEEEGTSAGPVSLSTNQKADQPADTAQFHVDSDTDVEEDNDALDNVSKSVLPSADAKHPHFISFTQPEGLTMDSDTDVDDDDAVSDAATEAKPVSFESTHTADSAPSTQPKDFHLDSDTDVEEEEEKECGTNTVGSKTDETPTELDIKPSEPESAAPHTVHVYSDTDDEAAAVSEPSALSVVTESITTADKGADLSILSDSDTDLEDESLVPPVAFTSLSLSPATKSADPQPDSAADADRNTSSAPPAGEGGDHVDLGLGSDANVEDKEGIFENEGEDQIPSLCRENTPGLLVNPLCSTPLQMSEGQVEDMDTQAFLSPSKGPFRSAVAHAETLPFLSDSNEDEDYVVAETQSFVLQTREGQGNTLGDSTQAFDLESAGEEKGKPSIGAGSFQSHLQAQALAMESTQAFLPLEGGVTLEETQAYAANSNTERNSLENDTQAYAKDENAGGLDLEATQAYISEPSCDSEDEADRNEMNGTASAETQPLDFPTSSTLAMAETQPMAAFEEEESLGEENLVSAFEENPKALNETVTVTETQPMCTSDNEESDDEDSVICSRRRQSKPLQLEDEQTQTLTNSDFSALDTQPMGAAGDAESDEDSIPVQRKRKAKRLHVQDEESQTLTNSELSAAETPPMEKAEDGESDEEDSVPGPRKRKAKPLQIQEEESQPLTNPEASTVETELLEPNTEPQHHRGRGGQSDAGTSSNAVSGKRGTRTRLKEEEEDQEESSEPSRRQSRGKNVKAQPTTRGRRGRPNESEEEEEVEPAKRTRGKKSMRQQQEDDNEEERLEIERRKQEQEKIARERREKEEQERLQSEKAERLRLEVEKAEAERRERERQVQQEKQRLESEKAEREKERAESAQKDKKEQLERERKEQAEKERIKLEQMEKEEQERLERENKEKIEKERKEQAEKERLETAKRDVEDRLARERNEREVEREKQEEEAKEKQINEQEENMTEAPARSRRAARRTIAVVSTTQDSNDVPARRTRSRSNSSNSVSSERSASSVNAPVSRGRGRGRGATRTNEPPPAAPARSSNRRKTVAAGPTQHDGGEVSAQGVLSRSNSTNSLNSEISSCSSASRSRGRGARQRGRGRGKQIEARSVFGESSALKPTGRGRKSRKGDESTNEIPDEDNKEQNDCQTTTRGRRQATTNVSEPAAAEVEGPSIQESATEGESPLLKRNVSSRVHKLVNKSVESPVGPAQSDEEEAKRKGRKRELEENTADPSSSCKTSKVKEKADTTEEAKGVTNDEIPVQAKRRGRASSVQAKRNAKGSPAEMEVTEEKTEEETVKRKGRGRQSAIQDKRKEQQDESGSSVDQDAHVEALEPQTPRSSVSRKRQAPADLSPVAKTPRSSSASPAVGGRSRSASQTFKVLFTGVVDEAGERVLARLGGNMAKGVADMNCLVTDKVRRTVKFLCAVAKGVPIVTTHWLEKSGKAGSFLSPHAFIVKDPEQEKKFSFCLQESLGIASSQLLLQGYEIHVTKSVKPEPVHMKDIISCSGATFLPKMPSSHKPQTLVISCEEDLSLCGPALAASLPVVTAEFILTGILQQKLDLQTHSISAPVSNLPVAGGRGRKKT